MNALDHNLEHLNVDGNYYVAACMCKFIAMHCTFYLGVSFYVRAGPLRFIGWRKVHKIDFNVAMRSTIKGMEHVLNIFMSFDKYLF